MTEYEEYQQTGMLGGYLPERAREAVAPDGRVTPVYRDTAVFERDASREHVREMYIGGRMFRVRSVFDSAAKKTPTEAMLEIIDSDLEKETSSG